MTLRSEVASEAWASSSSAVEVELILPEQYWAEPAGDLRGEPQRRLMLAVLEDAILTLGRHLQQRSVHSRRIAAEVEVWIASDSRAHLFAFASICDVLGFEISSLRRAIAGWKTRVATLPRHRRSHAGHGRQAVAPPRQR